MLIRFFWTLLFITTAIISQAQDTLPNFTNRLIGNKAALAWINTYDNITGINIQRSGDSVKNFITIATILNAATGINGYIDKKEFIPNEQFYRLFLTFSGGEFLFTKPIQPIFDSSENIIAVLMKNEDMEEKPDEPEPAPVKKKKKVKNIFVPSAHVFYSTGKQDVVLNLPNAKDQKYTLKFWKDGEDGEPILEINKLPQDHLILDKVNFVHSGLFRFRLFSNGELIEEHKIYIPKNPKRMPQLDINGHILE